MKEYFCNNCGRYGHQFHQCKNPITSIGIVVFKYDDDDKYKYLMIRRKDSLGYVDFIRGKYPLFNKRYILNIMNEMTRDERNNLATLEFDELWNKLWGDYVGVQYRSEEKVSREKFNSLKSGINILDDSYNIDSLIKECTDNWSESEWGFAKGRRNYQENDLSCALREYEEETGYSKSSLNIIQNLIPIEEIFTGSNYKSYKHKYYLAYMDNNIKPVKTFQKSEVSMVEWFTLSECIEKIRPYNLEKKEVLKKVEYILNNYKLF